MALRRVSRVTAFAVNRASLRSTVALAPPACVAWLRRRSPEIVALLAQALPPDESIAPSAEVS